MKKQYIIPIFVPHQGCPNECIFCNQKTISGQKRNVTEKEVEKTIEYYLKNFENDDTEKEIAFYGGSFTGIDEKLQNELLEIAYQYIKKGKVQSIRISTRPDYINKETLKRLKKYKVKTIELGVQSTNNYILEKTKRGHTFEDIKRASKLIRWYGFTLGHQIMVGLPESTRLDELNTAKDLIKLKPKLVRIYPVLVIRNTELQKMYEENVYEPLPLEQAVDRCKELYYFFTNKKINVIRIGLQNTNTIKDPKQSGSEVIAGPYHPAFRQLVEDAVWYDNIVGKIKTFNVKAKEVEIIVNPIHVNSIMGHKKENVQKLRDIYDVDIRVRAEEDMKSGKMDIRITKIYQDFKEKDVYSDKY